jgi:hypothetical protein
MARVMGKIAGSGGCQGDHCPGIRATDDPEMLAVQGTRVTAQVPGTPGHEEIVLIPVAHLREWAAGQ